MSFLRRESIVLIMVFTQTAIAYASPEVEELFKSKSAEYHAQVDKLGEELADWCGHHLPVERAQEATEAFARDRVVLHSVPATFRAELSTAQQKYLAILRRVRGRIADEELSNKLEEEEQHLLDQIKLRPRPGLYKVVVSLHKQSPPRSYRLSVNAVGGYEIEALPDPATNLKSSVGVLSWDDDKCVWCGHLESVFANDPQQKRRSGVIVVHPIDYLHFEMQQPIHQWDDAGRDRLKLRGRADWVWYAP